MARNTTQSRESGKQQSSGKTASAPATTRAEQREQERSIETGRESGRESSTTPRRGLAAPVRGAGLSLASPFSLMRRVAEDMDRLFQDFGIGSPSLGLRPGRGSLLDSDLWTEGPSLGRTAWTPQVETFRRGDKLVVRADLPGLRKEDVAVEIDNDVLTISGVRSDEHEEDRDGFYRSERSYGEFFRAIPLPDGLDADESEASFEDGVLEVTFPAPKTPERRAKRIQIR